ncbi:hypothetical protein Tco_1267567 [Tanacetum coccineum]
MTLGFSANSKFVKQNPNLGFYTICQYCLIWVFDLLGYYCRNPYHSGLVVGIESIEPAEIGELNASAMEVKGLMSQVSTSIPADVVCSKASDLSTINGDASKFAGSLNIQVGDDVVVYVMKDANVANVVEE